MKEYRRIIFRRGEGVYEQLFAGNYNAMVDEFHKEQNVSANPETNVRLFYID
jgi:hypothetical protein